MKTIIFCLPGASVSHRGLASWSKLFLACPRWGLRPLLRTATGAYIHHVRNDCLGSVRHGPVTQKPFQGQLAYDYLFWIDNDVVYEPQDFKTLYDYLETHPSMSILSGTYPADYEHKKVAAMYKMKPLTFTTLAHYSLPFVVNTCSCGFMLVRHGVFEALEYPWFEPLGFTDKEKNVRSVTGEDWGFCYKAALAGFKAYLHPRVVIGHEKPYVIR